MHYSRKQFIRSSFLAIAGCVTPTQKGKLITVNGPVSPAQMGPTLIHEHVLVDFIGADRITAGRYKRQEVFDLVLPHLRTLRSKGCKTLVECTPAYLGRDVLLLQQLSKAADLNIVTNTGWYGASREKFLPAKINDLSAKQVAEIWINEARGGIDGTGIKPGFMKLAVDDLPFSANINRILEAAVITYKATGLPMGVHTSSGGAPAKQQMKILQDHNVPLQSWIWIHAQNEKDISLHIEAARKGGWISFDNVSLNNMDDYLQILKAMKNEALLGRVLISHDAGWYDVEQPTKKFRGFTDIFDNLIPFLKKNNFSKDDIDMLLIKNPALAFSVRS